MQRGRIPATRSPIPNETNSAHNPSRVLSPSISPTSIGLRRYRFTEDPAIAYLKLYDPAGYQDSCRFWRRPAAPS